MFSTSEVHVQGFSLELSILKFVSLGCKEAFIIFSVKDVKTASIAKSMYVTHSYDENHEINGVFGIYNLQFE